MRVVTIIRGVLICSFLASVAQAAPTKISIYVTPFYNSKGPEINIGKYGKELKTNDLGKLETTASTMFEERNSLRPEQMHVLAIRLYEVGEKDEAVYWFYEAQFRARLFNAALLQPREIGDLGFELKSAYGAFQQLAGVEINGYAGCDLNNWLEIIKRVKSSNLTSPDLQKLFPKIKFVEKEKWDELNTEVSSGMDGLSSFIEENRPTWKEQRAANNADEKFCK